MISFTNDYSEIAVPEIVTRIASLGRQQFAGYGLDEISNQAREKIKKCLQYEDCDIHFLVGGTQANKVMIDAMLRPFEAVAAVTSGHINVHESGAIESSGHKIEALPAHDGKMKAADLEELCNNRTDEHMVIIRGVYISNATEIGTVYTKKELQELREVCDRHGLYLFLDGARLGTALMCEENDLTMHDLCELCDCFYIGATKNGGMLGEAMVIINNDLKYGFRNLMKQNGAMMAKGVLLGIQFDSLFTDDLFFRMAAKENRLAMKIRKSLEEMGFRFLVPSPTNQQFPVFPNELIDKLHEEFEFLVWEKGEKESPVRLVTSWATAEEDVDLLIKRVMELHV